ncbi:hypothetical protein O53_3878 [Microcystis aeruginosa TAIHU98]|uniref:Uncharacterized protein n=1 Tax=Microcystis aeruginosa TAIHU98 TaxID=1134457 RepID=L7E6G8_MICAE|nr:hypothetical protein O53_3878 [Microcystis aeruginosa TAIHU98]ODV38654.1 hypothetical protein BFG60_1821 [Microcystis aeruginosa NIES-98]
MASDWHSSELEDCKLLIYFTFFVPETEPLYFNLSDRIFRNS